MEGFVKICAKDISVSVQQNFPAKIARFVLKIKVLQRRFSKKFHFQFDRDECLSENPCQNGGECINEAGGYICLCLEGFKGA